MKQKTLGVLAVLLSAGTVTGAMILLSAGAIPTCGCQNTNGQPYPWCPVTPCPSREGLWAESSKLNSPTNITLNILNTGSTSITFIAYYVREPNGNPYSNTAWSGPTIQPGAIIPVNILTDGRDFTFQSRTTYTVEVVTLRSTQFTFTAIA